VELYRIGMKWGRGHLARQCAGSAAELGVVRIGTVLALDDQLAVGKVRIVDALRRHRYNSWNIISY